MYRPFSSSGLSIDGWALLVLLGLFGLTGLPALLLAWRGRWIGLSAMLALAFPVLLVTLFLIAISTLD